MIDWLLDSDPSIRWQVMRDLLDAPEPDWRRGAGQGRDGGLGRPAALLRGRGRAMGGRRLRAARVRLREWQEVGQPWTATTFALSQLREFGLDPASDRARRAVELVGANSRWEHDGQPFWEGEVEECINGRTVADGAYFGVDVSPIVDTAGRRAPRRRRLELRRADGSVRSSFASTINVLEGLLEYERATGGTPESRRGPQRRARSYLLERNLFRRLSTGEPADDRFPVASCTRTAGTTTSCGRSTTSARRHTDRRRARPTARRGHRARPLPGARGDGTWPLDWTPARPGLVRGRRRAGPAFRGSRCGRCACSDGGMHEPRDDATRRLAARWAELDEGALVERLGVAHALADLQDDPRDELRWICAPSPSPTRSPTPTSRRRA